ncbi:MULTISPECIES: metal-dependent transcriptional regulator [Flavobacterium]|jgi:DtxR family Mn-dependent transcriptional regulator|uniref:Transcriptional regulator MntR n=2 Tax=Flavobacterium TaxID=237 RepID=A0A917DB93_9FLAO|nr:MULTISPECIES: metal-dependent transcriptional regulator [Flavobacterium]MCB0443002.1 metal-dependent transcriptional regulator [Flavobacterium sp.]UPQ80661.1 metal-dependent transcriptional regulator [Flavobacterium azooxidireducens]GGD21801.1 iron-dependent repressor [Flavobacterium orientale]HBI00744.1 iron-dependent repressor [Flavobacterium sp.]HRE77702.1 metal-dependent transcriptional regulator [Flavobacterium sp.]
MTYSEENYIKVIYHLSLVSPKGINTNAIAGMIESKASSVTDMVKKLAEKELVDYQKYQGVTLTQKGLHAAKMIVRKHRLWEVFLVEKLDFTWDEVHDLAEELEHIKSEKLINRLDEFLGFPKEDPHGDPIPDRYGQMIKVEKQLLSEVGLNKKVMCLGVKDSSPSFLQYLDKHQISLGSEIEIINKEAFDMSLTILMNGKEILISNKIAGNLFVKVI